MGANQTVPRRLVSSQLRQHSKRFDRPIHHEHDLQRSRDETLASGRSKANMAQHLYKQVAEESKRDLVLFERRKDARLDVPQERIRHLNTNSSSQNNFIVVGSNHN